MFRYVSIGLAVLVVTWGMTTPAFAQRDSGAKARGDTESFWDPKYKRSPTSANVVAPRMTRGYRSYSYEPSAPAVQLRRPSRQPLLRGLFGRRSFTNRAAVSQTPNVDRGYRSFSFEPNVQGTSTSSVNRRERDREPWQYPKTDPRRYRVGR